MSCQTSPSDSQGSPHSLWTHDAAPQRHLPAWGLQRPTKKGWGEWREKPHPPSSPPATNTAVPWPSPRNIMQLKGWQLPSVLSFPSRPGHKDSELAHCDTLQCSCHLWFFSRKSLSRPVWELLQCLWTPPGQAAQRWWEHTPGFLKFKAVLSKMRDHKVIEAWREQNLSPKWTCVLSFLTLLI